MDEEIRYMYTVYPKRMIVGLENIRPIRSPRSLLLTKDQVKYCLQYGTVYRRFGYGGNEKVTPLNLDRLHNETLLTESEFKVTLGEFNNRGTVLGDEKQYETLVNNTQTNVTFSQQTTTESTQETPAEVAETVATPADDNPEIDPAVEVAQVEEAAPEKEEVKESVDTKVDVEPVKAAPAQNNNQQQFNYSNKKKKH